MLIPCCGGGEGVLGPPPSETHLRKSCTWAADRRRGECGIQVHTRRDARFFTWRCLEVVLYLEARCSPKLASSLLDGISSLLRTECKTDHELWCKSAGSGEECYHLPIAGQGGASPIPGEILPCDAEWHALAQASLTEIYSRYG